MPPKPYMPSITDAELSCISDEAYHRLANRDLAQQHYSLRLEAVIKSTWSKVNE